MNISIFIIIVFIIIISVIHISNSSIDIIMIIIIIIAINMIFKIRFCTLQYTTRLYGVIWSKVMYVSPS